MHSFGHILGYMECDGHASAKPGSAAPGGAAASQARSAAAAQRRCAGRATRRSSSVTAIFARLRAWPYARPPYGPRACARRVRCQRHFS